MDYTKEKHNRDEEDLLTIDALFVDALGLKRACISQEDERPKNIH